MRRWTLAVALLLAVLFPLPSPAEDPEGTDGPAASAPAAESDAAASAPEEGAERATAAEASEAAGDEAKATGDEAEPSGDESEAAGDEAAAPEKEASAPGSEEGAGEEGEEESAFTPVVEYLNNVSTQFLTGLNGLLTWPADPVMATVNPPKAFDKAGYPRRPLGFASGLLLMLYRGFTGTLDVALAPGPLPVLSPVPRYKLIPGFEHEDE